MGESTHRHQAPSRLSLRNRGGEILEVEGGHVMRSIGRKDRHSKVCTSKGPRDRRVRLAAPTAIQFYDVLDRLGYDRPSKAVDWLIKKAKASIDELAHLPAWNPTTDSAANVNFEQEEAQKQLEENQRLRANFLPPSVDFDDIADTVMSFFPMSGSVEASSSAMHFQSIPTSDLISRTSSHSQDLRLPLQSFQDPILLHHHHNEQPHQYQIPSHHTEQTHVQAQAQAPVRFTETTPLPLGFDDNIGRSEHYQQPSWNNSGNASSGSGGEAGFLFDFPPAAQLLGQNQFFSQRGPLQSSNTPSFRTWMYSPAITIATSDHSQQYHPEIVPIYRTSISGVGFTSGIGTFSGFHFPARIQGDEEEHDRYPEKPSFASSDSRH
ncbi:transcription factor TCP4-like [Olea europaea var. sylvestris]|uniref:TCP domain-containing protein n=1 Tax=Olea europaea subsp. europaea TaxID=158383 RepID=A0A8S0UUJ9_OLEEU|nr:transcription factor TCP4-like [Olea europaea var. sylvestris]CAA3024144.1 Hypothetical predicted protein [Olea europaea subsp. europaea]